MVRRPNPKWSYFSLWLGFYGFFGILVWNVTTVSCYCSIKKKIQADKWPLLSLNLRKCVDQGRWYIYIIRIWKILFISSPWRKQDFRKKKATRLHTLYNPFAPSPKQINWGDWNFIKIGKDWKKWLVLALLRRYP